MKTDDQDFKLMLAERLKKVAQHLGLQEQGLAQRLGLSKQAMSNYTTGRNEPKPSMLVEIVNTFSINPEWLLTGAGDMLGNPNNLVISDIHPREMDEKLTPAQREMLTYKRIQTELGMPNEKIAAGIEAIAMGKTRDKKSYCTAEPPADPGYNNIHEPGAGFGEREKD